LIIDPLRSDIFFSQIIARIQTPSANIRRNINNLLIDVGKHHLQALIYPLTVASKSSSATRKSAALAIMDRMREHSPTIVLQVSLVPGLFFDFGWLKNFLTGFIGQPRIDPGCNSMARDVARRS
jgi:phosphatidylinositol kinase/protein kinase (PI-3  family)